MRVIALVLLAIVGLAVGLAPLNLASPKFRIHGKYIVMYHKNVTSQEMQADLLRHATLAGVTAERTYNTVFRGYSGAFTDRQLALIRANPKVALVEEDQMVYADQTCSSAQNNAGWGLTRVSQRKLNLDDIYVYPSTAKGVTAYIIDTGVYVDHSDFGGRAVFGFKSESSWSDRDGNGHGTHVASTVGGRLYGVAKEVNIVAVKVLSDGGSGSIAGVIAGVDWAASDNSRQRPKVGNMSLGGGYSATLNAACDAASEAGVNMVVAAGNDNGDACNTSPASAENVITVGATSTGPGSNGDQQDVRSYFSNYGTCVDIFAPGSDILGAWIGGTTATRTISGTSMASPHVCGVAALAIAANPSWGFKELKDHVTGTATLDAIDLDCTTTACNRSPNLMAYNGCR